MVLARWSVCVAGGLGNLMDSTPPAHMTDSGADLGNDSVIHIRQQKCRDSKSGCPLEVDDMLCLW